MGGGVIYFFILEIESGRAFKAPPAPGGRGAGGGEGHPTNGFDETSECCVLQEFTL